MEWFLKVIKQYADFSGRARRKEYWMYVLFYIIFGTIAIALDNLLGITMGGMGYGYGPLYLIFVLALFVPSIAVAVRRLHDTGKSGWWLLISFVPVIGGIWLIVLLAIEGKPGVNEYGANPKEVPPIPSV